jgi:signal transduction histidine kinase
VQPNLDLYGRPQRAVIRVLAEGGTVIGGTSGGPDLGEPVEGTVDVGVHRVRTRRVGFGYGSGFIQYARRLSEVDATVRSVRVFLLFGVLAGSSVALAAGLLLARRAMAPIAALTATTREIARTRDPNRRVPVPEAKDEVSELARTLEEMLRALESSRAEGAAMLSRQRQFVADASHELRTPLTAVLANLELLPRRSTASSGRRPTRPCAPPGGCGPSSPTCCSWPAPTRAASPRASPRTSRGWSSRRRPSCSPSAAETTTCGSTRPSP